MARLTRRLRLRQEPDQLVQRPDMFGETRRGRAIQALVRPAPLRAFTSKVTYYRAIGCAAARPEPAVRTAEKRTSGQMSSPTPSGTSATPLLFAAPAAPARAPASSRVPARRGRRRAPAAP